MQATDDIGKIRAVAWFLIQSKHRLEKASTAHIPNGRFLIDQSRTIGTYKVWLRVRKAELAKLRSKHYTVLTSQVGGLASIKSAEEIIDLALLHAEFPTPEMAYSEAEALRQVSIGNEQSWVGFLGIADTCSERLLGIAQIARAAGATDVFGMSLWRLLRTLRDT